MNYNYSSPEFLMLLKNRDSVAITDLVEKYNKQLFHAAIGQGLKSDMAEEILQSTWSAFFEGVERFEGRSHIRTYLFGILYNKIKEQWRLNKRFVIADNDESTDSFLDSQFNDQGRWAKPPMENERFVWATEAMEFIELCLEGLNEKQRLAFSLREVEGENSEDICKILDVSRTNLGVLLYRAKNLLRKCLESKAITREDIG